MMSTGCQHQLVVNLQLVRCLQLPHSFDWIAAPQQLTEPCAPKIRASRLDALILAWVGGRMDSGDGWMYWFGGMLCFFCQKY